ncbi:leucine-rich repeat protein [Lactonifactor longoviformis]|uniref:leucine-rich repeat protein n=1 Tax=Lactonifactor longoviformis TaxID=341220 RepID=UPI002108921D|nr:leucine-rich repeat protein [Lactonifactor longoviformis]MCQ4672836.1 leucine-rich repeat protein [Lactonifactor longoviformis]
MRKRIIALLLAAAMAVSGPETAYALQENAISGIDSQELSETQAEEVLEEEAGTQAFAFDNGTITGYLGEDSDVVIPEEIDGVLVTAIGKEAFRDNQNITSVSFPSSLVAIGQMAFSDCRNLSGVLEIPDSVETIGSNAFYNCIGFSGLQLGNGLKTIESYAFYGCTGFTGDLILPDSVASVGSNAFYGNSGFDGSLKLSGSMTAVSAYCFAECKNLTGKLEIPDSVKTVGYYAFRNAGKLTSVELGQNVTELNEGSGYNSYSSFEGCDGVADITFRGSNPPGIRSVTGMFQNLKGLESLTVPAGAYRDYALAYGDYVQNGVRLLTESEEEQLIEENILICYTGSASQVEIPEGVTEIGPGAFQNNTSLQNVTIPQSVEKIDRNAFRGCAQLEKVEFPMTNLELGEFAFYGCSSLSGILEFPENLSSIRKGAFQGCSGLEGVILPEYLAEIGDNAFYYCTGLSGELSVPPRVRRIGSQAFYNCSNLSTLILQEGLEAIGDYAFSQCSGMKGDLTLPDTLTALGTSAFSSCSQFERLTLSENLTQIKVYTFSDCKGISGEIVIPDSVVSVGYDAFRGLTGVECFVFGTGLQKLNADSGYYSYSSFSGCTGVKTLKFRGSTPPSLEKYTGAFREMSALTSVIVPVGTYQAYSSAYGSNLPDNARITEEGSDGILIQDGIVVGYTGHDTQVEIPEGVTEIGTGAFQNNTGLQKVILPVSIRKIGNNAFRGCTGLSEINWDMDSVTIGDYAFYNCGKLTGELILPEGTDTVGSYAFYKCTGFTALRLPAALTSVGSHAFNSCTGLQGLLTIPGSVETVGDGAFAYCSGLSGLRLEEGIQTIGREAFYNCAGMQGALELPDSVTSLGGSAFSSCKGFESIRLSRNLETLPTHTFFECRGVKGEVVIPDKVTAVGYYAFYNMKGLTRVVIGAGVTSLNTDSGYYSYGSFEGCSALEKIVFRGSVPPDLKSYKGSTFSSLPSLKELEIPSGTYGAYARAYSSYLQTGQRMYETGQEGFITEGSTLTAYAGNETEVRIPDGITEIGRGAFQNHSGIESVILPDSVEKIAPYAFRGCTALREVSWGEGIKEIGDYAFGNCSSLEQKLILPDGIAGIGEGAFYFCEKLQGAELPKSLNVIGKQAFYNCTGMKGELRIPGTVSEVKDNAFAYCKGFTSLVLEDGIQTIGESCFYSCSGMRGTLTMPDSIHSVGNSAFSGCIGFAGLRLSEELEKIAPNTFSACTGIQGEVVIPDKASSVGYYAFYGCKNITDVTVGANVQKMNEITGYYYYSSFEGCSALKTIRFKGLTPPDLCRYTSIFTTLPALETIYVPAGAWKAYSDSYGNYLGEHTRILEDGADGMVLDGSVLIGYTGNEEEVEIPEGITGIAKNAFRNNRTLKHIKLPQTLTYIEESAFRSCSGLSGEIAFPERLNTIGNYAFYGCQGLNGPLILPESTETIGDYAFYNCFGFTSLTLGSHVTAVGNYAFYGCKGLKGNLWIPDSVTYLGGYAFYECTGLDGSLHLSENISEIKEYTITSTGLQGELIIPDSVRVIGYNSFYKNSKFTSITVGKNVESLNQDYYSPSFYSCSGVTAVTFLGTVPPDLKGCSDTFRTMKALKTIYTPKEAFDAYKSAYSSYVPASVEFSWDTLNLPPGSLRAANVFSNTVHLTWNPSNSDQVAGYYIYRNNQEEPVGVTEETWFTDTGLLEDASVTYYVCGYTQDGRTTKRASVSVRPKRPFVERIYTDHILNKVSQAKNIVYARVKDTGNLGSLGGKATEGQFYYLNEKGERIPVGEVLTAPYASDGETAVYRAEWDLENLPEGMYTVGFDLTDVDGRTGAMTQSIYYDSSVPEKISSLTAVGDTNRIVLNWSMAHEADTTRYHIYRRTQNESAYTLYKRIYGRDTLSYTDAAARENLKYYYYIVGVNDMGQEGIPSEPAAGVPQTDKEPPRVVKMLPSNGKTIGGSTELYVQAEDNVAVVFTQIYLTRDKGTTWELLSENRGQDCRFQMDTSEYGDGLVQVKGVAVDAAGNRSSGLIYTYKIDNQGPDEVTGLSWESTSSTITLRWKDVADKDLSFFRVEQKQENGEYTAVRDESRTLGVNLTGLRPDRVYTYRIVAYDQLGNRGIPSQDIAAKTKKDTEGPVITNISPKPGYYRDKIPVSVTAEDNSDVASIEIQISSDRRNWEKVSRTDFAGSNPVETAAYELDISKRAEGPLYIRAVAADRAGNQGDTSSQAPYVEYISDRTAPGVPQGLTAVSGTGYIEVTWEMGEDPDLDDYRIYRAVGDSEEYELLAESVYTVNYVDRTAEDGVYYAYRIQARDYAGNVSSFTEPVGAGVGEDTIPPKILSIFPADNGVTGPSASEVRVLARDNRALDKVTVFYRLNEETAWRTLKKETGIDSYYKLLSQNLPVKNLNHGDRVYLKAEARDALGNTAESEIYTYTVDKEAPAMPEISVSADQEAIGLSWTGNQEEDLAGYRIYRRCPGESYRLTAQRSKSESGDYQYRDEDVEKNRTYLYKVEAVDQYGNASCRETDSVWVTADPQVHAVLTCESNQEAGVEYTYDASGSYGDLDIKSILIDFGDGTAETGNHFVHKYTETGTYTVTLTVTDTEGNTDSLARTIEVTHPQLLGTLKVKVADAEGSPISGAPVYFNLDSSQNTVKYTGTDGCTVFSAGAARYAVGSYMENYLPVKKNVVVRANTTTELTLTMVREPIVSGGFEVDRMTLDEIVAAGIDVTKPENQHVMQITIHLTYGKQPAELKVITNGSDIYKGGTTIIDTDTGTRKVTATVIPVTQGGEIGPGSQSQENVMVALMDIPVEASCLKEFFDVKLHLLNHASGEFNLTSNQVHLHVPDGLTVVDAMEHSPSADVAFSDFPGQTERTISWVLRGDKTGEYSISADYSGVLDLFQAPVQARFEAEDPIQVYGISGLSVTAEINRDTEAGALYFTLGLTNEGETDVNLPSIDVMDEVIKSYEYGEEEWQEREVGVKALHAYMTNTLGARQNLDADYQVPVLRAGETYTKKYVAYGAITGDEVLYLQKAVTETMNGLSIPVKVIVSDMNLYDISDSDQKIQEQMTTKKDALNYVLDMENTNYYYYIQALEDDKDFWKKLGEAFYSSTQAVLKLDVSYLTTEEQRKLVDPYILQLLEDESFQDAVDLSIDKKLIDLTKSMLGLLKTNLQSPGDITEKLELTDGEMEESLSKLELLMDDEKNLRLLAKTLGIEGADSFAGRLSVLIGTSATSNIIRSYFEKNGLVPLAERDALLGHLGDTAQVVGLVSSAADGWNYSCEFTNLLLQIQANREEADFVLDTIIETPYLNEIVVDEAKILKEKLGKEFDERAERMEAFCKSFVPDAAIAVTEYKLVKYIKDIYSSGTTAMMIVDIIRAVYSAADYLFDWSTKVENLQKLRFTASLTYAFRMKYLDARMQDSNGALKALKYLIKMRLIGEKAYIESIPGEQRASLLAVISREQQTAYESLEEYYRQKSTEIISSRDQLFNASYKELYLAEGPEVTLNYADCCTAEAFGEEYEYSWNGVNWKDGEGAVIRFTPREAGQVLWVRRKASGAELAGNITKTAIPGIPYLTGDIACCRKDGYYLFENLPEGAYEYLLLDAAAEPDWSAAGEFAYKAGERLKIDETGKYIVLRRLGSNAGAYLTSYGKQITITYPVTIQVQAAAGGTVSGGGAYLPGEAAVLRAEPDYGYEFAGWYKDNTLVADTPEYHLYVQEEGTYEARFLEKEKGTVIVSGSPSDGGQLTGGGMYPVGEEVTIQARPAEGWRFLGWYQGDTCVTSAGSYIAVCREGEERYTARFERIPGKNVRIYSKYPFTINGNALSEEEYKDGIYTKTWEAGQKLRLCAADGNGRFAYWAYGSGQILSRKAECTITLAESVDLYAVYTDQDSDKSTVLFLNFYGQVVANREYSVRSNILFPSGPSRLGYVFAGWDKTEEIIRQEMAEGKGLIEVKPLYEEKEAAWNILLENAAIMDSSKEPAAEGRYPEGTHLTVKANPPEAGMKFAYWTDRSGTIISYRETYTFILTGDIALKPVYTETGTDAEPGMVLAVTDTDTFLEDNVRKMSFTIARELPEDKRILSQGVLYTTDPAIASDKEMIRGSSAGEKEIPAEGNSGIYRLVINNIEPGKAYYCRSYLVYREEDGTEKVVYSRIAANTYIEEKPVLRITGTGNYEEDGVRKLSFISSRSVPEDCQLLELGFLYTIQGAEATEKQMTLENEKIKRYQAAFTRPDGTFIFSLRNAREGVRCYARAYLVYRDRDGNQHTQYSNIAQNVYQK